MKPFLLELQKQANEGNNSSVNLLTYNAKLQVGVCWTVSYYTMKISLF